MLPSAAWWRQ